MKFTFSQKCYAVILLAVSLVSIAQANISGIMGPNINPNDRSLQFRTALSPADNDTQQDNWSYRLHYQHAFNDTLRGRILVQYRDRGNFEYDFLRTELLYNFKKRQQGETWSSALRFDLRTRRGSRPEEFAVNWGSQWDFSNAYRVRATLILAKQLGASRDTGKLLVQTRASIGRKLDNGIRVELQMLNQHGELGDFGSVDGQSVFLGPAVSGKYGEFKYEFRYLHGMTDPTRNNNFFFRVTKAF